MTTFTQKPYLNAGCGRIILPAPKPAHHALIDDAIYGYPLWLNADRNAEPGVDQTVDLFRYPWPWADNSFDGALLTHIVEHIPHEAKSSFQPDIYKQAPTVQQFLEEIRKEKQHEDALRERYQDGWYAFMSELYRVLTPGSIAHILSPYAWSQGAVTDPTHTRLITEHVWTHSMRPDPDSPFRYETGGLHFEMVGYPRFNLTEPFGHLRDKPEILQHALMTQINVVYEIGVQMRAIK